MYKKFADLLVKNNKTAYRVSRDTGIPANTFSDWKNGRSKPKADKSENPCRLLRCKH